MSESTREAVPQYCSECGSQCGFAGNTSYYKNGEIICSVCHDIEKEKTMESIKPIVCSKCGGSFIREWVNDFNYRDYCSKCGKSAFPISKFTSQEQLDKCLEEWKHRLSLNDWIIKASLIDSDKEFANPSEGKHGECHCQPDSNRSMIRIKKHDDKTTEEWMEKQPDEIVLVHELLHCKIDLIKNENTMEGCFYGLMQHKLLEEIAKALIMAKYNLTLDWFKSK